MFDRKLIALVLLSFISRSTIAMYPMYPLIPRLLRPEFRLDKKYNVTFFAEHGFDAKGFNFCGDPTNVLQIYEAEQNAIKMLEGFGPDCPQTQLLFDLLADGAFDDGVRGHFKVCGNLDFNSVFLHARWQFIPNWFFTGYLPIHTMQLKNVVWQDLTQNVSAGDLAIKQKLLDNFFANVQELGDGLYLGPWRRSGVGDLSLVLEWIKDFPQPKPLLKNVHVNWRFGVIFPTGLQRDENKIFAFPFGLDGSYGLVFGFTLNTLLGSYLKLGFDVELVQHFGHSRCRRIKTAAGQTDLLQLAKAKAFKDYGLDQRFNLYADFRNLRGFTIRIGYQFAKHGDDILSLDYLNFNENVANSSVNLEEYTGHEVIADVRYDFSRHLSPQAPQPTLSLFTRIPVMGRRSVISPTIGGAFILDF
jgi:hypothetical protein